MTVTATMDSENVLRSQKLICYVDWLPLGSSQLQTSPSQTLNRVELASVKIRVLV